jgi:hypothetical protein
MKPNRAEIPAKPTTDKLEKYGERTSAISTDCLISRHSTGHFCEPLDPKLNP